jgi:hypothetical protein
LKPPSISGSEVTHNVALAFGVGQTDAQEPIRDDDNAIHTRIACLADLTTVKPNRPGHPEQLLERGWVKRVKQRRGLEDRESLRVAGLRGRLCHFSNRLSPPLVQQ